MCIRDSSHQARKKVPGPGALDSRHSPGCAGDDEIRWGDGERARVASVYDRQGRGETGKHHGDERGAWGVRRRTRPAREVLANPSDGVGVGSRGQGTWARVMNS